MMDDKMNMELGDLLEQRIQENYGGSDENSYDVSDERLKEMNKKLPDWSLEPPFSFLK
ncbi:hypothetical protein [Faecalicatena orotica]|uniref:hypothetical protein n=1 Tax=Faecalicatena orotica TaxID=1544 RepID=UPI003217FACE